ncbi:MAG: lytic transglycosylase domain-containing protein [Deltaproteobacteria bacterium]|nr:lytic transglycosylase domain-containing protein [Deltaproteobacteria bacterium]
MKIPDFIDRFAWPGRAALTAGMVAMLALAALHGAMRAWRPEARRDEAMLAYVRGVLGSHSTGLGAAEENALARFIIDESEVSKIDPLFVLALMKTESGFYNRSKSSKGAVGLMQLLPSTGEEVAGRLRLRWRGTDTLLDPYVNVKMGVYYFTSLKRRYNQDTRITLAAYNAGPTNISGRIRSGEDIGAGFADRVFKHYNELKEGAEGYKK